MFPFPIDSGSEVGIGASSTEAVTVGYVISLDMHIALLSSLHDKLEKENNFINFHVYDSQTSSQKIPQRNMNRAENEEDVSDDRCKVSARVDRNDRTIFGLSFSKRFVFVVKVSNVLIRNVGFGCTVPVLNPLVRRFRVCP